VPIVEFFSLHPQDVAEIASYRPAVRSCDLAGSVLPRKKTEGVTLCW
jgi:hypothetical protein